MTATTAEKDAIIGAAAPYVKVWLLLCSDLAIRSGTAARLGPRNYDAQRRTLTFITKGGRNMTLPVTAQLDAIIAPLARLDPNESYVNLLHPSGTAGPTALRLAMREIRKRIGIKKNIRPHDLRRTTANEIYTNTRDLRIVQAVLGHKRLDSTLHYLGHGSDPVDLNVLELAKLDTRAEVIQ